MLIQGCIAELHCHRHDFVAIFQKQIQGINFTSNFAFRRRQSGFRVHFVVIQSFQSDFIWSKLSFHDSTWFIFICFYSIWFNLFQHDSFWFTLIHFDSILFTLIHFDSILFTLIHFDSLWRFNSAQLLNLVLNLIQPRSTKFNELGNLFNFV